MNFSYIDLLLDNNFVFFTYVDRHVATIIGYVITKKQFRYLGLSCFQTFPVFLHTYIILPTFHWVYPWLYCMYLMQSLIIKYTE